MSVGSGGRGGREFVEYLQNGHCRINVPNLSIHSEK